MKYLPTIDLNQPGIATALYDGQLKLQCGQWVLNGPGTKSRFVGRWNRNTVWAVHGTDKKHATKKDFLDMVLNAKLSNHIPTTTKRKIDLIGDREELQVLKQKLIEKSKNDID